MRGGASRYFQHGHSQSRTDARNPGSGDPVLAGALGPYSGDATEHFLSTATIQGSYERLRGTHLDVRQIAALAASNVAGRSVFVEWASTRVR